MNRLQRLLAFAATCVTLATACATLRGSSTSGIVRIRIATEMGSIIAELDSARAPVTVSNFLRYVDGGFYRAGAFHRTVRADNQPNDTVRIAVIQGARRSDRTLRSFPPIPLERTRDSGIRHRNGTLSMARNGPDSATDGFFICVGDQPPLDFGGHRNLDGQGFAAFGRVTQGMDIVRRINAAPANAQSLTPPVGIISIERVR